MVNRPIVAHLRPPTTELARAATTRSVLAPSHQRCSSVQVPPTLDASGGGEEATGEMRGFFFASFNVLS